ncbi:MAG: IS21-like element helper ATPase IstB [Paludibacter sp.]
MNQIQQQLVSLRLNGMNRTWQALVETRRSHELTLAEGLEILLQAEVEDRTNKRFERLVKEAKFRYQASIEELIYDVARGFDRSVISTLATGDYVQKGESVLITGSSGCGKSFLTSALGHHACAQGYTVRYFNIQKLLLAAKIARLEGTTLKFFDKIAKTQVLILDDFGLAHIEQQQLMDLMEIIEDRHGKNATIIASQLPVTNWYDIIGEATIADAILDRLVHTSYRIEIKGESLRKKQ